MALEHHSQAERASVPQDGRRHRARLRREHVLCPITALAFYEPCSRPASAAAGRSPLLSSGGRRYLLAAEDTDLKIYEVSGSVRATTEDGSRNLAGHLSPEEQQQRLLAQIPIFSGQSIHGISVRYGGSEKQGEGGKGPNAGSHDEDDDDLILIWGGYSVAVLSGSTLACHRYHESATDSTASDTPIVCEFRAPDWVFDAKISPFDPTHAVLLTAHNEVVEVRIATTTARNTAAATTNRHGSAACEIQMASVRSPSRPILYAGNVLWLSAESVLVAAGTVFGEVVVWKWHAAASATARDGDAGRQPGPRCEYLFAFAGHEGSIFGIQISPELVVPELSGGSDGEKVRLLATCSDDRTVRIWDITERREQGQTALDTGAPQREEADGVNAVPKARETGFGPNTSNSSSNSNEDTGNYGDSVEESTALKKAEDDNVSSRRCVAVAMGHISRIWHVEFAEPRHVGDGAGGASRMAVPVYSFGEDATAQKWHLSFGSPPSLPSSPPYSSKETFTKEAPSKTGESSTLGPASLMHKATYRNHTGKHIWSRALLDAGPSVGGVMIATGGSDGKIALVHDEDVVGQSLVGDQTQSSAWRNAYSLTRLAEITGVSLADDSRDLEVVEEPADKKPADEKPAGESAVSSEAAGKKKKPKKKVKAPKESFQRYAFISENKLLVITNQGRCFVGSFGNGLQWKHLPLSQDVRQSLTGYCIVESSLETSTVYIGTGGGEIYALTDAEDATLRLVATVEGKIADLFALEDCAEKENDEKNCKSTIRLLITVLGAQTATLLLVKKGVDIEESAAVELERGFVITAATIVEESLILGSRNGAISISARNENTTSYTTAHSHNTKLTDAITSIVALPQRPGSLSTYFLTTCRDGKYRVYQRQATPPDASSSSESIVLLQETSPPFGPLIERAWFTKDPTTGTTELMLCGFRSTNAVLWNATQQREVAAIDCGGAHRSFTLTLLQRQQPARLADGFRFVFTKASEMHIFSQTRSQAQTVKPGSHGREIRAVSSSGRFTATAAEDTVIRIHEYVPTLPLTVGGDKTPARKSGGVFRCVASIEKHATGIQAVRWHRNEYLFSSGGNEEFFVWRVNRIDSDVCPLGIACEAVFQDKSEVGDLRIMDFDTEPLGGETQQFRFCITMALSNSAIQSYVYSRDEGFRLLGRRHYTGACLMQLRHLGGFSDHGDHTAQPHVLTAATDGHLAVFVGLQSDLAIEPAKLDEAASGDLPKKDVPEQASGQGTLITKLHQSGIKSLDMLEHYTSSSIEASTGSRSYLVVTGGDDNAIGVLHLCSTAATGAATTSYTVRSKSIVRSAHAAAVTGIGIARLERGGRDAVVVSTGNDQRVKTWRVVNWQQQQNQSQAASTDTVTRVELVADEYSGVADAGDLEIMRADEGSGGRDDGEASGDGKFLVGGVGMEVWRV